MAKSFSLEETYIHLRPDEAAVTMQGGEKFWAGILERTDLATGRLMGKTGQSKD